MLGFIICNRSNVLSWFYETYFYNFKTGLTFLQQTFRGLTLSVVRFVVPIKEGCADKLKLVSVLFLLFQIVSWHSKKIVLRTITSRILKIVQTDYVIRSSWRQRSIKRPHFLCIARAPRSGPSASDCAHAIACMITWRIKNYKSIKRSYNELAGCVLLKSNWQK